MPDKCTRAEVYAAVDGERDYQDSLKDTSVSDGHHTATEYLLYIEDYVAQARHVASSVWGPTGVTKTLDLIRKITALGVSCMEQNGVVPRAPAQASQTTDAGEAQAAAEPEPTVQRLLTINHLADDIVPGVYELTLDRVLAIARPGYTALTVTGHAGGLALDAVYAPEVVTLHLEIDASQVAEAMREAAESVGANDIAEGIWADALHTLAMMDLLHSCWQAGGSGSFSASAAILTLGAGLPANCFPAMEFRPLFGMLGKQGFIVQKEDETLVLTPKALVLLSVVYAIWSSDGHEATADAILKTVTMDSVRSRDYGASIDALIAEKYIARTAGGYRLT